MRVAVANLTAGGLSGGYRKYLTEMVPRLAADPAISALRTYVPAAARWRARADLDIVQLDAREFRAGFPAVRQDVRAFAADVVFVPTAAWARFDVPTAVMIRNMEPLEAPVRGNAPAEALRNLARAWRTYRACARATRIIAVSSHVRTFLVERWRVDARRIGLVYHGVDRPDPAARLRPPAAVASIAGPFLFTAGSIRPQRGLEDAIAALPIVLQTRPDMTLVVAGAPTPDAATHAARLREAAARATVAHRIVWAGELSATEMSWCYRACRAFLMTSRVEACPNVALEAMAHGCLIASVDRPPMPEFLGTAARYYLAGDSHGLARAVEDLLGGPARDTAERSAEATRLATKFTWEQTTRDTVAELRLASLTA
jgi:glycosyltransferase involved in cell wall biosynthesis